MRKFLIVAILLSFGLLFGCSPEEVSKPETTPAQEAKPVAQAAEKKPDPLAKWQPGFDPSKAEHTYLLSCIGHPAIKGVAVGFEIRDEVWERSNGRLFVDYRPLAQLGGEKDVLRKLQMGAVQGMLSSSVAAANLDDRLGLVNLPFLIDTTDKLEQFRLDDELFSAYGAPSKEKGIVVADFTGYGGYGWASRTPAQTIEEAKGINFRIAQAPVNTSLYKTWGMKFTVMPWPDVPQALQTGVIDGLDHTPIVCSISRKFDNVKNYTLLNYAQGLYIHLINRAWLEQLPEDLQTILLEVVTEQSAIARQETNQQEADEIENARGKGVSFWKLQPEERAELTKLAEPIFQEWAPKIGEEYLATVRAKMTP